MLRARVSPLQKRTTLASFQIANRLAKAMAPLAPYGTLESKAFGHQGSKDIHRLIAWQPRWGSNSPWESKQICIGHEWWFSQKIWNMQKDWTPNWLNSCPSGSEKRKLERAIVWFSPWSKSGSCRAGALWLSCWQRKRQSTINNFNACTILIPSHNTWELPNSIKNCHQTDDTLREHVYVRKLV